jgi:hypothetical protein
MNTETKNLLDTLTLDEIKKYLDTRQGIVFYKIRTIDSFVDELNVRFDLNETKEQWEQACLEDGIQNFAHFAYDFYDTYDENSYDPDLFEMTWQDMVEDEIEGAVKALKRQSKLDTLIDDLTDMGY